MWADSMIVLGYLNNKKTRFKTSVANRLTTVLRHTKSEQWRHVEGKINPAGLASKVFKPDDHASMKIWQSGSGFFKRPESQWPSVKPAPETSDDDPETGKNRLGYIS